MVRLLAGGPRLRAPADPQGPAGSQRTALRRAVLRLLIVVAVLVAVAGVPLLV